MTNQREAPTPFYGKVFELGDYPDRGISVSETEMDQAISEFKPVPNDIDHTGAQALLGHHLGYLKSLRRRGADVMGELVVPQWLAELANGSLYVSLAFDANKRVVGNALTTHPRIADAHLVPVPNAESDSESYRFSEPMPVAPCRAPEVNAMKPTLKERVRAWFVRETPQNISEDELNALFAKSNEEEDRARGAGARFAEAAVAAGKFLPYEQEALKTLFAEAVRADAAQGATFDEGAVCHALRTMVDQRPSHNLDVERFANANDANAGGPDDAEARRRRLLGATHLGRKALKRKENTESL